MSRQTPALFQTKPTTQTAAVQDNPLPGTTWKEVEASKMVGPSGVRAGKQGRPVVQSTLFDLPDPATYLRMMRGLRNLDEAALRWFAEFAELLEEIEPQYGSLLDARKKSVQRKPWFLEAADDSSRAVEIAEFGRGLLRGGWFRRFIYDALDAKGKGLAVLQKIYSRDAQGLPTIERAKFIPLSWLTVDRNDGKTLLLRDADDPKTGIPLDPINFVTHTATRKSGLAVRGGFAVPVGALALGKVNGWNWVLELLEQYGIPFREATYVDGTSYDDVLGLEAALQNMGRNGYIIKKKGMEIQTIDGVARGGSADAHKWFLEYADSSIAKMVAGGSQLSEGGGGSLAKAQAQQEIRDDLVDSDALELEETIQTQLIEPLIRLRFGEDAPMPVFRFHLERQVPLTEFLDGVKTFVELGGKVQASSVRDRLQLEEPQDDAELLGAPAPAAPGNSNNTATATAGRYLGAAARCPVHQTAAAQDDLDEMDRQADEMLTEWEALREPLDAAIGEAMKGAGDPATRRELVATAVERLDIDGLVQRLLANRLKTRLAGQSGGDL